MPKFPIRKYIAEVEIADDGSLDNYFAYEVEQPQTKGEYLSQKELKDDLKYSILASGVTVKLKSFKRVK